MLTNNPIELLISLGVNDKTSKDNIKNYIKALQNQLPELDALTLTVKSDNSNNKVFSQMEKQIQSLQNEIQDLNKQLSSIGKGSDGFGSYFLGSDFKNESKKMKNEIKGIELTFDQLINKLKSQGYEYQIKFTPDKTSERNIKQVIASIKNEFGEVQKITFEPNVKGNFNQIEEVLKNNDPKIIDDYNSTFNKLLDTMNKIERTGKMSSDTMDRFRNEILNVNSSATPLIQKTEKLNDVLAGLNRQFQTDSHQYKMKEAMDNVGRSAQNLISQLEKVENTYKRTVDKTEANRIRQAIIDLPTPKFANEDDIKKYRKQLKDLESDITSLSAKNAAEARSSMTMLSAFKTAMEKFPIDFQVGIKLFELLETP